MKSFVNPEATRLPVSDGEFIEIKRRLNHGESEDMYARMAPFIDTDGHLQVNRREVRTAKVLTYLLGWTLTNNGKPVPMSTDLTETARLDTIRSLDPDRFNEIHQAIEAHETAVVMERAAEKKDRDGAKPSSVISPSPVIVTGDMSGSVS